MIVITGGAGFIGSVLAWKFNELGENGLLLVDQKAQGSPKWKNVEKRRFEHYLESDEFIWRLEDGMFDGKIRAVFHLGACSDTTEMDRNYLRENNSGYSERVAGWCLKNNVYLAYASSAATYGEGAQGFSDDDGLTPSLHPLNPYGQSKLDFDVWVLRHGFEKKITGFRFFNVYGPNEYHKGAMRSMVHKGYEQVMRDGKLKLFKSYRPEYPDGGQKRDFVYVKDVVDAMIWFYRHPLHKGIFNLGAGAAESWNDLADALFKAAGKPKKIEYIDMPESIKNQYQYYTAADLAKLRQTGCPTAFLNVEHGVNDYVRNYLGRKDPYL
jgi:ADP-L-glycero-D-manno-heptose 6-epimerase